MLPEKTEQSDFQVLPTESIEFVNSLDEIFATYMSAHSEFQIRNFIINDKDFPTPSAKYHQCIRELNARRDNLLNIQFQHDTLLVDMEINMINSVKNDEDDRITDLNKRKLHYQHVYDNQKIIKFKKQASEIVREMRVFTDIISSAISHIPDDFKNDAGVPLREPSELETWTAKGIVGPVPEEPKAILATVKDKS